MILDSRVTWDKLAIELDLLNQEEPRSLLPLLIGVHSLLRGHEFQDWCARTLNFMAFELAALCDGKSEQEKLEVLNHFFFETKDFQICSMNRKQLKEQHMLLRDVLAERSGASLVISLIYVHLATQLDLPLALVNISNLNVLKWMRGSRSSYLDLTQNGRVLDEEGLLQLISQDPGVEISSTAEAKLEVLSYKKILLMYLQDLLVVLEKADEKDLSHAVLSMLLKLDPNNLKFIGDRALLRKDMGFHKEAMNDIKRYLSFTDIGSAPVEIQYAFREITALSNETPETIH
jgi:regulator of sirC expression with transglutaminase-like and TPR domain